MLPFLGLPCTVLACTGGFELPGMTVAACDRVHAQLRLGKAALAVYALLICYQCSVRPEWFPACRTASSGS